MKRNFPRNHSPHRRSNHSRRYNTTVQHINNNVNVSFDMRSEQGSDTEDNERASSRNNQRNAHLWNHPRLPRDSSEHRTGRRGDNRMQRGCPNGTRPSECDISDNNLNSPRSPSGMSAPNGSSMVDPTKAEILPRRQSSRHAAVNNNNNWSRVESIAENNTPFECEISDNNLNSSRSPSGMSAPNGSSMDEQIEAAAILWRTQSSRQDEVVWPSGNNSWHGVESTAENEPVTPVTGTETISQSLTDPIFESSYFPGFLELESDSRKFHLCYNNGTGPNRSVSI